MINYFNFLYETRGLNDDILKIIKEFKHYLNHNFIYTVISDIKSKPYIQKSYILDNILSNKLNHFNILSNQITLNVFINKNKENNAFTSLDDITIDNLNISNIIINMNFNITIQELKNKKISDNNAIYETLNHELNHILKKINILSNNNKCKVVHQEINKNKNLLLFMKK